MWSITFRSRSLRSLEIIWLTGLDEKKKIGLKMQNVPCSERETPPSHCDPPPARLLCSLAGSSQIKAFGDMEI